MSDYSSLGYAYHDCGIKLPQMQNDMITHSYPRITNLMTYYDNSNSPSLLIFAHNSCLLLLLNRILVPEKNSMEASLSSRCNANPDATVDSMELSSHSAPLLILDEFLTHFKFYAQRRDSSPLGYGKALTLTQLPYLTVLIIRYLQHRRILFFGIYFKVNR
ncbi:hypothetical protein EIK77_001264 [Talaromyces pinophilus]|nr:hypothetical protein EIK77_001264 [Talaromyces pinophilus]